MRWNAKNVDIDGARAREEAAEGELNLLREQLDQAMSRDVWRRGSYFESIVGDDAATKAAADREEALAAMKNAAASYVRARASVLLLRWAIDRFRREKQGPLLKKASELFRMLTRNSFEKADCGV